MEASMNWKLFVPLGLFAAGAVGGYMYASHEYGEEIANVKLQAAIVRANDGRKAYEKLVAAQNALDASRRDQFPEESNVNINVEYDGVLV